MAQPVQVQPTLAEFLAIEAASETRHEYDDGEVVTLSGGTSKHSKIKVNVVRALAAALEKSPCSVFDSDMLVLIAVLNVTVYPDASVACNEDVVTVADVEALTNPVLVVEVLSTSTAMRDRTKKFDRYKMLDSFQDYLLIDQDEAKITYYHRVGPKRWFFQEYTNLDEVIELEGLGVTITLAQVYQKIVF